MAAFKPRVISLTKRPGHTFGFYLRLEQDEDGHLIRCLEMGGPAELAGMKDGDRILRVNGTFADGLPHSEVVDLVRNSGASVTFHILDEASYKQAKAQGVNLSDPQTAPVANGVSAHNPRPKLCYLVKSSSGFGFSLRSVKGEEGLFMTEVIPGGVAYKAGVRVHDRLLEINGENVKSSTHDQAVEKIKQAGGSVMFLLVDEETDEHYRSKGTKVGAWLATAKHLPHKPRIVELTKGPDGYGFLLRMELNLRYHYIKDIDRGSPAERAGLKDMDRLVSVDGMEVDSCTHEQVVDRIRRSGNNCCLMVVDKETDQMYQLAKVSPIFFSEEMKDTSSPPSYTEAINLPAPVRPSTPSPRRREELKPKLCKMTRTSGGFGFHLNGIQGVFGHYIKEVVTGGVADRAGLEDDDIVVEVNGVNVERSSHDEVVAIIRGGGDSLEMLVAKRSVYDQLKADGVTITRLLLGETSRAQVHSAHAPEVSKEERRREEEEEEEERRQEEEEERRQEEEEEEQEEERRREEEEEARPETPTESARDRTLSSLSQGSLDERF